MSEHPPTFDYAPPLPLLQRRRVVWRIAFTTIVAGTLIAIPFGMKYAIWAYRYHQQQKVLAVSMAKWVACRAFAAPADQVVYDEDPARGKALLADTTHYANLSGNSSMMAYRLPPPEWMALTATPTIHWDPGDTRYSEPLLFLHERDTHSPLFLPNQQVVAVLLESTRGLMDSNNVWTFQVVTILPITTQTVPSPLGIRHYTVNVQTPHENNSLDQHVRFFAGQKDPADPLRFTINYDINGSAGVLEGFIHPDGHPSLRVSSGPATRMSVDRTRP